MSIQNLSPLSCLPESRMQESCVYKQFFIRIRILSVGVGTPLNHYECPFSMNFSTK